MQQIVGKGNIVCSLKKVRCQNKDERGERVSLPNSTLAPELSPWYTIEQHRRFARRGNALEPRNPAIVKPHAFHDLNDGRMLNRIKCFSEVQFQENDFAFRSLALVYILKGPSKTVMDGSFFQEPILVFMNNFQDHSLQSIG